MQAAEGEEKGGRTCGLRWTDYTTEGKELTFTRSLQMLMLKADATVR